MSSWGPVDSLQQAEQDMTLLTYFLTCVLYTKITTQCDLFTTKLQDLHILIPIQKTAEGWNSKFILLWVWIFFLFNLKASRKITIQCSSVSEKFNYFCNYNLFYIQHTVEHLQEIRFSFLNLHLKKCKDSKISLKNEMQPRKGAQSGVRINRSADKVKYLNDTQVTVLKTVT